VVNENLKDRALGLLSSIEQPKENANFPLDGHFKQNKDYYKLTLKVEPDVPKLPVVHKFISSWMGIDSHNEALKVSYIDINNKQAQNRFVADYENTKTGLKRKYYLDFDFKDQFDRLESIKSVKRLGVEFSSKRQASFRNYNQQTQTLC